MHDEIQIEPKQKRKKKKEPNEMHGIEINEN